MYLWWCGDTYSYGKTLMVLYHSTNLPAGTTVIPAMPGRNQRSQGAMAQIIINTVKQNKYSNSKLTYTIWHIPSCAVTRYNHKGHTHVKHTTYQGKTSYLLSTITNTYRIYSYTVTLNKNMYLSFKLFSKRYLLLEVGIPLMLVL